MREKEKGQRQSGPLTFEEKPERTSSFSPDPGAYGERAEGKTGTALFHLPGLFEFLDFYRLFLPLFFEHREYFYPWCGIGSIYGAPRDCLWGGGRVGFGGDDFEGAAELLDPYGISARLTFSNAFLREEHLSDRKCNELSVFFEHRKARSGVIVHSDLLLSYLRERYPDLYFVSSTTKVITAWEAFEQELSREDIRYVVPDFRLNIARERWSTLPEDKRGKVEFLCNECCDFACRDRKACYENVSRKVLGEDCPDHVCHSPYAREGYVFSRAMENPGFIGIREIRDFFLPLGYTNFKIEGRSLGSALILEFLLYYMTKPEYQLKVREKIYLTGSLDLF